MKTHMKAVAVAALAIFSVASHAQSSGVSNMPFGSGSSGWSEQGGNAIGTGTAGTPISGTSYADLTGGQSIYQSFTVYSTGNHLVSFMALGNGAVGLYNSVDVGNQNFNNPVFEKNFSTPTAWTRFNYNFGAFGSQSYHLYFDSTGSGLKLDGVSVAVAAVPEPETYAMLLAGLGMMGFVGRRRMRQA